MGNPNIQPPNHDELSKKLKAYLKQVKIERKKKKTEPQQNVSIKLDQEIPTFLASPKIALEFANHLKQFRLTSTSQNIKNLLTSKKRNKIVLSSPRKHQEKVQRIISSKPNKLRHLDTK